MSGGDSGGSGDERIAVRRATHDDYDAVAAMVSDLWADRGGDYIPRVYHEWLEDEGDETKKTFVAEVDGAVAGIVQGVLLSDDEVWFQGMRVAPQHRRLGVSRRLNEACFAWARDRGATVGRIMVFSWNTAGLGAARGGGYEPVTEFRWAHPEPNADADADAGPGSVVDGGDSDAYAVANAPAAAWRYWTHSEARAHLDGLGLAPEETWAVRELTRADFDRFADETAVFAVEGDSGLVGAACRTRTYERSADDGGEGESEGREHSDGESTATETWAEYGVGAWEDVGAARALFAAIARDAAVLGADRTRVLIPETVGIVSDASYAGAAVSEEPDFVLGIDLAASANAP
ncbi:GNAT family N-acetyltransferase [Halosolutus gelatinilyticus]|uniref:GNAT family N-acetyltransferase n=1 Tax=Halosolutus gelatinilyticus TaxID=2931975 RepID=UPI001FF1EBA4|nr:GNAT family N-acetyltransferase [Halosolutus gelatinilyticus]